MAQEIVNRVMEFSTLRSRIQTHIDPKERQPSGSLCKMKYTFSSIFRTFISPYTAPALAIRRRKGHKGLNEPST